MNLRLKLPFFGFAALLAGMILSGCGTTEEPVFTDNPNLPAVTDSPTNNQETATDAARFSVGETVVVGSSTGSDAEAGPITPAGQGYVINDDGTITLPLIGQIQAAGKTPGELQEKIQSLYVPQYYVRLTVTVSGQNRVFYVGGEVGHPGPQVYIGQTTVTTAIQAAGDFTQFSNHKVWLTRPDGTRIKVNVDKALEDSSQDPPVFPGDKIQVPRRIF